VIAWSPNHWLLPEGSLRHPTWKTNSRQWSGVWDAIQRVRRPLVRDNIVREPLGIEKGLGVNLQLRLGKPSEIVEEKHYGYGLSGE